MQAAAVCLLGRGFSQSMARVSRALVPEELAPFFGDGDGSCYHNGVSSMCICLSIRLDLDRVDGIWCTDAGFPFGGRAVEDTDSNTNHKEVNEKR